MAYVYILSGQKFIKNAKKWSTLATFWKTWSLWSNSVTEMSFLKGQKWLENAKIEKHFGWF